MNRYEYTIWGIPEGATEETLLMSKPDGKYITDKQTARRLANLLTDKYNCRNVRIHEMDLTTPPDFVGAINL